ncbi:unnamed protein product [Pedinophyceae sp. YPF-701]|nr:unnamed protein product [Pedinophyceae sp. YPF-701]
MGGYGKAKALPRVVTNPLWAFSLVAVIKMLQLGLGAGVAAACARAFGWPIHPSPALGVMLLPVVLGLVWLFRWVEDNKAYDNKRFRYLFAIGSVVFMGLSTYGALRYNASERRAALERRAAMQQAYVARVEQASAQRAQAPDAAGADGAPTPSAADGGGGPAPAAFTGTSERDLKEARKVAERTKREAGSAKGNKRLDAEVDAMGGENWRANRVRPSEP